MAWQCDNGTLNSPANPWPYAILARADDNGHLSVAGQFQILQPYLEPCVEAALGGALAGTFATGGFAGSGDGEQAASAMPEAVSIVRRRGVIGFKASMAWMP